MRIRHWKGYTLLFGLTLLIPALIFSGGLRSVLPFFAAPKGEKGEAGADSAEGGVVCYGYADLESGVVSLYPDLTGRVVDVPVHENDVVAAGAVLVRLDDHLARLRVDEARAALESAQAQLAQAQKDSGEQGGKIARQEAAVAAARHRAANARHSLLAKKRLQAIDAIGRSRPDPVTAEEVAAAEENVAELEDAAQGEEDLLAEVRGQDPSIALRHARADVATMEARLGEANETLEEQTLRAARGHGASCPGRTGRPARRTGEDGGHSILPARPARHPCGSGPGVRGAGRRRADRRDRGRRPSGRRLDRPRGAGLGLVHAASPRLRRGLANQGRPHPGVHRGRRFRPAAPADRPARPGPAGPGKEGRTKPWLGEPLTTLKRIR